MGSTWYALIIDAVDPERLGRWWAEVLDHPFDVTPAGEVVVGQPAAGHPRLIFVRHAEAKHAKNRLHLDLSPDDLDAELERLVNMGARHVDLAGRDDEGDHDDWVVLADPEGNEFCVLKPGH